MVCAACSPGIPDAHFGIASFCSFMSSFSFVHQLCVGMYIKYIHAGWEKPA